MPSTSALSASAAAASWRRVRRTAYLLLLVAVAALVVIFWPTLAGIWRHQALTFVIVVAVMACGTLVQANSFLAFLDPGPRVPHLRFAEVWAWSALANYAAPLQPGIALRVAWLRRRGIGITESLLATWRQLLASLWLALLGVALGFALPSSTHAYGLAALAATAWLLAAILRRVGLHGLARLTRPAWLLRRREMLVRAASRLTRRGLASVAVQYILGAALTYGIYLRFGASITPGQALLVCCLAYASSVAAILPGNFGIVEAIYMLAGHGLGLGLGTSAALALFIRVAHVSANLLLILAGSLIRRPPAAEPSSRETPMAPDWHTVLRTLPTEVVPYCLLCRETPGLPDPDFGRLLALAGGYGVLRCPDCGLRWLSPRPTAAGYATLYSDALYFGGEGASPDDYGLEAARRLDYWRHRVRDAVRTLRSGYPLPVSHGPATFLDVGAATGEFVHVARTEGHACTGLELSADARATARARHGIDLLSPDQQEVLEGQRFDVIHMNHVFEHLPDPLARLRWCHARLQPGGLLVIEVPQQFDNDLDRLRRALGAGGQCARFDAYSLHHTFFFSPATLAALLIAAGFEVERLATFNRHKAPWWPFSAKNWILRPFLTLADRLHRGGNIIEVYARRA